MMQENERPFFSLLSNNLVAMRRTPQIFALNGVRIAMDKDMSSVSLSK